LDGATAQPAPQQAAPQQQSQPSTGTTAQQTASRSGTRTLVIKKGDGEYTVKVGDTLSKIATVHHVKGGWHHLFELNKNIISNADLIFPGQHLHLS
jgi:nucleoid-associated protein YgaU